ncbi:protein of unknown function [Petrocella atlantisensis]|uniref:Uncharacterized protein n=1 Tax=Petrocella atlantisensis TaxID=2173034 RepID=A0A3P7NWJ7_9FIRM|nr:protein of unknown function [Petrocella atlantisensis]
MTNSNYFASFLKKLACDISVTG